MGTITGEISLGAQRKLIFSIEKYKGNDYASLRVWIDSPTFQGPTHSGLILDKNKTKILIDILNKITKEDIQKTTSEKLIDKILFSDNKTVRVSLQYYKAQPKLDIREYITSGSFEGYTKRGISIHSNNFNEFVSNIEKLYTRIPNPSQQALFQEKKLTNEIKDKKLGNGTTEILVDERFIEKQKQEIKKKKDTKKESIFSRLFRYYWYIQKTKTSFNDLTNLNKIIDYFDLSSFLKKESLFSGSKEEIIFKQLEVRNKKDEEENDENNIQEEAFEKAKKLFLAFQENTYERELVFGFPYIFLNDKDNDKLIVAPLFIASCKLEYETSRNTIKLSLIKDDLELNIAVLDKFLVEEGKDYIREEILKIKPHLPLDEKIYKDFINSFNSLLDLKLDRSTIPTSFELESENYREFIKEDKKVRLINKAFLLLARKSSFYILNNLEKLINLGDQLTNSILAKFFDPEDIGLSEHDEAIEEFTKQEYLFPYSSNEDQRRIVDSLSKDLILVQGPPGTGKSHTISNLICHLVANGKSVLVASQKNKALEVIDENYLKKTDINYLNMTLLKNDTAAKKELIEKISDLDYYISEKSEIGSESSKNESKQKYIETDETIAKFTKLFEETKDSISQNENLFRKYNKVKEFNLIDDNIPFLTIENSKELKRRLLELIKILRIILPEEEKIKDFISETECNSKNIHVISGLVKELIKTKNHKEEYFDKENFKYLTKIKKGGDSNNLPVLIEKSKELILLGEQLSKIDKEVNKKNKKIIESLLDEIELHAIQDQEKKLAVICENIETLKKYLSYSDLIKTDDPTEIDSILKIIRGIKEKHGIGRKIAEFIALIQKLPYHHVISNKIFSQFIKVHVLEDLENACLYKSAEITIKRENRGFYFNKEVSSFLEGPKLKSSEIIYSINNSVELLKILKKITILLSSHFKLGKEALKNINDSFGDITSFAITLNNYYNFELLSLKESSLAKQMKPFLKNKYKTIEHLIENKDNFETKILEELLDLCSKTNLIFNARTIEKELIKFQKTINLLKKSIREKNNFIDYFETNINKVFDCEILDNKIKELEQKYPLSTEEILEKISQLKTSKKKIIKDIIQHCIDINLMKNYKYSPSTQKDIAHFRRQIRRSKKNYKTFEELKEEFNFEALLKVFPCWIMSIEDTARVFPLKAGLFDYVLIDEASQCSLPSSVPTLFRGKKAIIVGDDKQLSDFTKEWIPKTLNESLINDLKLRVVKKFDSLDAKINSLFDSCSVFREIPILLREHFRSYPEIINFSNSKFYRDKLRIMTHSLNNKLGLILNIVEVENGIENDLKINEKEAKVIIDYLKKLISKPEYENLSFGILSLFREQANFMRKLIYEDDFLREHINENSIITDTVDGFQGDERDVILYSFRYANNSSPNIFTFTRGEDGWRRVNVAFTRARKQIFCFISQPIQKFPEGLVKEYLHYVKSPTDLEETKGLMQSDFEKDVYEILKQDKKLSIIPQFGTCGFFIDFVLRKNGKTLALECDGMQHFSDTGELIEEDIERQDILERAGWIIKRISSREFYRDPKIIIDKLLKYFD